MHWGVMTSRNSRTRLTSHMKCCHAGVTQESHNLALKANTITQGCWQKLTRFVNAAFRRYHQSIEFHGIFACNTYRRHPFRPSASCRVTIGKSRQYMAAWLVILAKRRIHKHLDFCRHEIMSFQTKFVMLRYHK